MKDKFRIKLTNSKIKRTRFKIKEIILCCVNSVINKELIKRIAIRGWKNVILDKRNPRDDIKTFQGFDMGSLAKPMV